MFSALETRKIESITRVLRLRVCERFPRSGLAQVAEEVVRLAEEARLVDRMLRRRSALDITLAAVGVVVVAGALTGLGFTAWSTGAKDTLSVVDAVQTVTSTLQTLVYAGLAVLFLAGLGARRKRRLVARYVAKLRSIAHVIDLHQLGKDPEQICRGYPHTAARGPKEPMTGFELKRYLNYCVELLSLEAKLAAVVGQRIFDPQIEEMISDFEHLANDLARRIGQKFDSVEHFDRAPES